VHFTQKKKSEKVQQYEIRELSNNMAATITLGNKGF